MLANENRLNNFLNGKHMNTSKLTIYGQEFDNRLLIGSALYPSPAIMKEAVQASGAQIITLSLRRQTSSLLCSRRSSEINFNYLSLHSRRERNTHSLQSL